MAEFGLAAALVGSAVSGALAFKGISASANASTNVACSVGSMASRGVMASGKTAYNASAATGGFVSNTVSTSANCALGVSKTVGTGIGNAATASGAGISKVSTELGPKISKVSAQVGKASYKEKQELERQLSELRTQCANNFVDFRHLCPEIGDIIEFMRNMYSHFGVYVGDGCIVHFNQPENSKSYEYSRDPIETIADGCQCRINNLEVGASKKGLTALSPSQITAKAFSKLNMLGNYVLLTNNCETFATECRYGTGFTQQGEAVDDKPILKTAANILGGILTE